MFDRYDDFNIHASYYKCYNPIIYLHLKFVKGHFLFKDKNNFCEDSYVKNASNRLMFNNYCYILKNNLNSDIIDLKLIYCTTTHEFIT